MIFHSYIAFTKLLMRLTIFLFLIGNLKMGREEGGGFRMGNTCIPVADSF